MNPQKTSRVALCSTALAILIGAASFVAAQQPAPRATPAGPTKVPGRVLAMPSPAQLDAISAVTATTQAQQLAVDAARTVLTEAAFMDRGSINARLAELATADLALATARAEKFAALQASGNKLTRDQVTTYLNPPTAGAAAAGGGRGGGRGAVGSQEYPADPNEIIQTLPGFKVEIVAKAFRPIQGSWVSLTEDNQGRLIIGANEQQPFTRLTLDAAGKVTKNETIYTPVSESMGSEWHDGSLYISGGRPAGDALVYGKSNPTFCCESGDMGLQRLTDSDNDGTFETVETLLTLHGTEEGHSDHGVHDIVPSPDGKYLYWLNGNMVYLPESGISPNSPVRNLGDDRILPLLAGNGGGGGGGGNAGSIPLQRYGLGGWIARMDFNAKDFHTFAIGLRNPLHFAFNGDGEIFLYDSDHEPEVGVPWYRPTRVLWIPSAANFGHRSGGNSGKYPNYYEDATPSLFDVGLGSPVGVTFGYNTKFPADYQKALYIADNNYGRIMAVHIKPVGSGYTVTSMENFAFAKSLFGNGPTFTHNVTDMLVAKNGSFYYLVGSRSAQSYLLRVTYTGNQPTAKVDYANVDGAKDRALRKSLEAFHWTTNDPKAVAAAWPQLGNEDRPIRYAARVALETVPAAQWKAKALSETDANTAIVALLALARTGGKEANEEIFAALDKFPLVTLPDRVKIQKLRVIEVAVSRNGKPSDATVQKIIADVDAAFPAATFDLNTEMSQILAAFNAPSAVPKTMRLAQASKIYQENFEYRTNIRLVTAGWTPELRRQYFEWFNADHSNDQFSYFYREWFARVNRAPTLAGNAGPMGSVRTAALATLTDTERADPQLTTILNGFQGAAGGGRGGARGGANPFGF